MSIMKFEGTPGDVTDVILSVIEGRDITLPDPGEKLDELAVMVAEDMEIATLKHLDGDRFRVTHIACYAPVHGAHVRYRELTKLLEKYNNRQNEKITCPICAGQKWLPVDGNEAKTGVSFAVALGMFRGVKLDETDAVVSARGKASKIAFANVFDNPLVTRIQAEVERQKAGADE